VIDASINALVSEWAIPIFIRFCIPAAAVFFAVKALYAWLRKRKKG